MSDVFISYSRKDIAFARLLRESLQQSQVDTWIDWERIPVGEKWWTEICEAIENANVFMFIISRNSIGSSVCKDEIKQALKNNKRIIPIIVDELKPDVIKEFAPELPQFNWIIFARDHIFHIEENPENPSGKTEDRQVALPAPPHFEEALQKLNVAIHTDWEWVKYHTRLQVNALLWENNRRNPSYLIRGSALEESELQLLRSTGKDPQPTGLQVEYVTASRKEETLRHQEQLKLEQKARQRQRAVIWTVGIGLVVAVMLGVVAWAQRNQAVSQSNLRATAQANAVAESHTRATAEANAVEQRDEAQRQALLALSNQLVANAQSTLDKQFDLSALLSIEAFNTTGTDQSRGNLLEDLEYSPQLLRFMHGHVYPVMSVAFSPDGKTLASGSCAERDAAGISCTLGEIRLWDATSGRQVGEPIVADVNDGDIIGVSFSFLDGGKTLISVSEKGVIALWDMTNRQFIGRFSIGNTMLLQSVAFSPNGRVLATGGCSQPGGDSNGYCSQGEVRLWNVVSRQPLSQPLSQPKGRVYSLAFSPDSQTLAAGDLFGTISLYNLASVRSSGRLLEESNQNADAAWSLAFSPDGKVLAMGDCGNWLNSSCNEGEIVMWDVAGGQKIGGPLKGQGDIIDSLTFSPLDSGKTLISGSFDRTIMSWDVSGQSPVGEPLIGHPGQIESMALSLDGESLASTDNKGNVLLWDMATEQSLGRLLSNQEYGLLLMSLAFSSDGRMLASGGSGDNVRLWDVTSGQSIGQPLSGLKDWVTQMTFSRDDQTLFATGRDGSENVWRINSGQLTSHTFAGQPDKISDMIISPDGVMMASAGCANQADVCIQGEIRLWNLQTGQSVGQPMLFPIAKYAGKLAFSPDGKILASSSCSELDVLQPSGMCIQSEIRLWDAASGQPVGQPLKSNPGQPVAMAFSPDGKTLASGSYESIYLWDVAGEHLKSQPIKTSLDSLAFSPDGKILAAGSFNSITLWDATSGQSIGPSVTGQFGIVYSLAFSPDGKTLASGDNGGEVILWDIDPASWKARLCSLANRNLAAAEWTAYLGNQPYRETCPGIP